LQRLFATLIIADGSRVSIRPAGNCCGGKENGDGRQNEEEFFHDVAPLRKASHRGTLHAAEGCRKTIEIKMFFRKS
jgi:hypothetical protein